jgi:hypothetical protein
MGLVAASIGAGSYRQPPSGDGDRLAEHKMLLSLVFTAATQEREGLQCCCCCQELSLVRPYAPLPRHYLRMTEI